MKTIDVTCPVCKTSFPRRQAEHNRSVRLGRIEYCTRKCQGTALQDNLGECKGVGHTDCLISNNRRDAFTGFRYYLRKAKERHPTSNMTLEDVKEQWRKQEGLCAYTGIPLNLQEDNWVKANLRTVKEYTLASLDRIDSSKPYDKDNIQFVSLSINLMKRTMTDADTKELIALIKASNPICSKP